MLYWLLVPLRDEFFFFNLVRYITVRTAAAGITALVLSFLLGPWLIRLLERRQIGQEIRDDGPKAHLAKKGTPSMGGILIILCTVVPTLVWGNLSNLYVWLAIERFRPILLKGDLPPVAISTDPEVSGQLLAGLAASYSSQEPSFRTGWPPVGSVTDVNNVYELAINRQVTGEGTLEDGLKEGKHSPLAPYWLYC